MRRTKSQVFLRFAEFWHRQKWLYVTHPDMCEECSRGDRLCFAIVSGLNKAPSQNSGFGIVIQAIGMKTREKLVNGRARHLHVDAHYSRAILLDSTNVSGSDL